MDPESLLAIDWEEPWFAAVADQGRALWSTETSVSLADRLNRRLVAPLRSAGPGTAASGVRPRVASGHDLRFVPQHELPADQDYESWIHDTGRVPTRDCAHDLFNGLAWLAFPETKRQINRLQASAIQSARASDALMGKLGVTLKPAAGTRGPLRDGLTVFDESGLILACRSELLRQALRRFDWQTLFVTHRADFLVQTEPWVLGHALLEKLLQPYKSITAHTLVIPVDDDYFRAPFAVRRDAIDRMAADWLASWPLLTPQDFDPLPVLGLPGWWKANAERSFYDDPAVFRPGRRKSRGV